MRIGKYLKKGRRVASFKSTNRSHGEKGPWKLSAVIHGDPGGLTEKKACSGWMVPRPLCLDTHPIKCNCRLEKRVIADDWQKTSIRKMKPSSVVSSNIVGKTADMKNAGLYVLSDLKRRDERHKRKRTPIKICHREKSPPNNLDPR